MTWKIKYTDEKQWTVYKLTAPNGLFYIGKTKASADQLNQRFRNGKGYNSKAMKECITRFPNWSEWKIELLYCNLTAREAEIIEAAEISQQHATERGVGLNTIQPQPFKLDEDVIPWRVKRHREVFQYDGECLVAKYATLTDAANQTGLDLYNIAHCCYGQRPSCGGYVFEFSNQ